MSFDLKQLASEVAKMTPEEREALAAIFGAGVSKEDAADANLSPDAINEAVGDLRRVYPKLTNERLRELAVKHLVAKRERRDPKPPRAEPVFFFEQAGLFHTDKIEADPENPDRIKKTGYFLPNRVIAVDVKTAARMYWKQGGVRRHAYIGQSPGNEWAKARGAGMNIKEAQAVEFEHMKTLPDAVRLVPPMNREKTVLAGRNIASISRGIEIGWKEGLKGNGL